MTDVFLPDLHRAPLRASAFGGFSPIFEFCSGNIFVIHTSSSFRWLVMGSNESFLVHWTHLFFIEWSGAAVTISLVTPISFKFYRVLPEVIFFKNDVAHPIPWHPIGCHGSLTGEAFRWIVSFPIFQWALWLWTSSSSFRYGRLWLTRKYSHLSTLWSFSFHEWNAGAAMTISLVTPFSLRNGRIYS